ncbi:MAG: acetyl-CoA acetyltransferase [Chloroflexi bacterium]|nr:acetyl-CoA acetyltransferase [Chloroflexota bacterium]
MDDRLPIIVGVGQVTQRPETERPREPLALMAEAARLAEADAAAGDLLHELDSVRVVNILSWPSKAPALDLAHALGVAPREALYTHIGGNTPQWQVNEAAQAIHAGDAKFVLIAGAEAMYSARRARAKGVDLGWSPRGTPAPDTGDPRAGVSEAEAKHGATMPTSVYPMFENALRAHYGRSIAEHQHALGDMMARFSAVAAANPHAWFREAKSAHDIATAGADNRYIGFPYPKYMNAIIDVDQGAALLLTSVGEARRLGIPQDRWVYLRGCGDATDHWFITERVDYHSSPAIRAAGARALSMAGTTIDRVAHFDLYSCFPSAVQITRDALGIAPDDPREQTVTGGLPYFGGPGNNYVTHSIASVVETLRADRGSLGLVTANGWYVTKHSTGIYSTEPPTGEWARTSPKVDQAAIDAEPHPPHTDAPDGDATVETYTVLFGREGTPERGIVIGQLGSGERFIANTPADRATLESMTKHEMVGAKGRASAGDGGLNLFVPS